MVLYECIDISTVQYTADPESMVLDDLLGDL
jgi:hypothetical protein